MDGLLWRLIERFLGRHLTRAQLESVAGDLAEDLPGVERRRGRLRSRVWLVRESVSVAGAYRTREAADRRHGRRMFMGGSWADDVRFAWRRLVKAPAATAASVLALACGIGGAAATWSLLSAVLLHPLPVEEPDRLFVVDQQNAILANVVSFPAHDYLEYRAMRDSGAFAGLAAGGPSSLLVSDGEGVPVPREVYFASHDFFRTLGIRLRGRGFQAADDQRGAPLVAVVSDRYWRNTLDADPDAIGRTVLVSDLPVTIVGITPRAFRGLDLTLAPDLYLPLHTRGDIGGPGPNYFAEPIPPAVMSAIAWIRVVGRLAPGVTPADATARLSHIADGTLALVGVETSAIPQVARAGVAQFTRLLAVTVGLLVLIGCVTVGSLLLVRTEDRRDELSMCLALGGTRPQLARGIVLEAALLSLAGAALALPVALWVLQAIRRFALPGGVNIADLDLGIDGRALAATLACGTAATVLVSLVAGTLGLSSNLGDVLRARAAGTPRVTRRRTRATLVAVQVAVSLVFLTATGLFARSLSSALTLNPGFDARQIVTGDVSLSRHGYTPERTAQFLERLRRRLDSEPGVESVSLMDWLEGMSAGGRVEVDGESRTFSSMVFWIAVDEDYFETMGMQVLQGRDFTLGDGRTALPVAIVSESLARVIAEGKDPLGHRVGTSARHAGGRTMAQIVGVVPDVITNVRDVQPLVVYHTMRQIEAGQSGTIVLRARGEAGAAVGAMLAVVRDLDPLVTPGPVQTIEQRLRNQMGAQDLGIFVLGTLGTIAILLTLLGAYVLAASMSAVRRREFSIRRALGGTRAHLGGLVLADTARLVGVGLFAGLGLAWIGAGTIRSFLFRVEPLDPVVLLSVSGAILIVTLLVSLKPALDAARVEVAPLLREQ